MLIYYILIILILLFGSIFDNNKNEKKYIFVICLLLSIIAGLRHYTIGNDTIIYLNSFNEILQGGINAIKISRFEIGYNVLVFLFTRMCGSFNLYLFIVSLIINMSFGYFIYKYSKNKTFSFLLFILCRFYFSEFNVLRQMLSLSVLLLSVKYIEERKFTKYLIFMLIAALFHKSILLVIPIYFLYNYKLDLKKEIKIFVLSFFIFLFLNTILTKITSIFNSYGGYVEQFMNSNKLASILSTIICLCIFLFSSLIGKKKKEKEDKIDNFVHNIALISVIINLLSIKISILDRYAIFFEIFYTILIPNCIRKINNAKTRLILYIMFFVCFLAYMLIITYFRPNWNYINPFRFYWQ